MKIAFFGTAHFSAKILQGILDFKDIEVLFVVSQEDKKVGRRKELQKTPIKILAEKYDIPILQPQKLKKDTSILEKSQDIDFFVVVAYGKIIPMSILDLPKYGSINLHGSLLPKYRGASPVQESLKNGDSITGLISMYMSAGMDEGDILLEQKMEVDKDDRQQDIFQKFETEGPNLLYKTLRGIVSGELQGRKQEDSLATYCHKIHKLDGYIDFQKMGAQDIYNKFRAYTPWPGIFSYYNDKKFNIEECHIDEKSFTQDETFKPGAVCILETDENKQDICVLCKEGLLILKKVKLEGKKSMNILDFVNGNKEFLDYMF